MNMQGGMIVVTVQQWLNNISASKEPTKEKRKLHNVNKVHITEDYIITQLK